MPRSILKLLQYVSAILNSIFFGGGGFLREKKLCKTMGFSSLFYEDENNGNEWQWIRSFKHLASLP